uniref:Transmembrane protein n=1 Tax=Globisporangium ultimum (strain ATCC 200006 / CBS 805.95 / DAOM BR144) TaxID=431595 RepID=K3WBT4_GLOUD
MALAGVAVPVVVVLQTVVMSLEILQHLLLARLVAMALMLVVWGGFLARDVQVKALLAAAVYHGVSELFHEWRANFPSFRRKGRDRQVIRWSLFWVRVFIWGATFAASSSAIAGSVTHGSSSGELSVAAWAITICTLTVYCEIIEVLVLLYFADQEIPYRWRVRVPLWLLSALIGVSEASGLLSRFTLHLLARVTPWGLVGVLIAGMLVSIQFPWHLAPAALYHLKETVKNAVVGQTKTTKKKKPRSSILSHAASDVEVVEKVPHAPEKKTSYRFDQARFVKHLSEEWDDTETDESSMSSF